MARRILVGVVAACVLAAGYATAWAARETRSTDTCVTGTPAGATWTGRDDTPLPWRWACVYEHDSGRVSRVRHTAFVP